MLYLTNLRIDGREQWWRWGDQLGGYCLVHVKGDDGMMTQTRVVIRRGGILDIFWAQSAQDLLIV